MTNIEFPQPTAPLTPAREKFKHPDVTARGEQRASVALRALETLWINTGSLCNIECVNCYIESSPTNDRLAYISLDEFRGFLDEIWSQGLGTREIGFTGGEPFMNRDLMAMASEALERGLSVLILTNAMQPMQRPRVKQELLKLRDAYGSRLALRISIDHWSKALHESERGPGTWEKTIAGLDWLSGEGFNIAIAGRTCWNEPEGEERAGYGRLIAERGWRIDISDPAQLVLFPEMDEMADVPEITTACWGILNKQPSDMMCASSRMVVKRKGAAKPSILPCTLLPYDPAFEMGATLAEAETVNGGMFARGAVKLCHPHCAKFCVLGGGSCSG
ncbi:MAG: radical SAM protein [Pseudomonadota bacterium]|nr:radical SAM protein [Pseudomonadota bacterium]